MTTPLKKHITAFLEYLEVDRGLSNATITNYSFYLHRLADFLEDHNITQVSQISKELIHKFRLYLNRLTDYQDEALLKKNTQNYHLIALRGFLKYLAKNDIQSLAAEKIELAKQQERQVEFLEGQDLLRILEAPLKSSGTDLAGLRDKAILELFFSTGLRVSELAKLKNRRHQSRQRRIQYPR
jgi:integrase/recombinase XerD